MAQQLTDPVFISGLTEAGSEAQAAIELHWQDYAWVYVFAFLIGFSTTIAEPSLIAVAIKANEVSGGAIGIWGLRIAVAFGVAIGISLGLLPHCRRRPYSLVHTSWLCRCSYSNRICT